MPVVDEEGKMIGVISEFDILKQIFNGESQRPTRFKDSIRFSKNSKSILDTTPLEEIIGSFVDYKFRRLPVVNKEGRLLGIITRRDLMRVLYYRAQLP